MLFAAEIESWERSLQGQTKDEGRLIIEPSSRIPESGPMFTLAELLEGVTPENVLGEIDPGPSVGREAW